MHFFVFSSHFQGQHNAFSDRFCNFVVTKPLKSIFMKKSFFFFLIFLIASLTLISCGHASPGALKKNVMKLTANGVSFNMIRVEGGTFTMGATLEEGSIAWVNENPAHQVTLSSYYIGETEVTQALWEAVMGSNPSNFKGANRSVEEVSWDDCKTFISKLNAITGKAFRLPTEAEWEYAARGGTRSMGYKYSGSNTMDEVGWYDGNSGNKTHDVKTKSPNELGIYDMSGNVEECCQDWYGKDYYSSSPQSNPQGPSSGSDRVFRGGSSNGYARYCRVSFRYYFTPGSRFIFRGLRLAL